MSFVQIFRASTLGYAVTVLGMVAAAGCGASSDTFSHSSTTVTSTAPNGSDGSELGRLCAAMTNTVVPECLEAYADGEPFRIPIDPDAAHLYGGLVEGSSRFATRSGVLPLTEAATAPLTAAITGGDLTYARMLYLATVVDGAVTELVPAALIADQVLLQRAFGGVVFEGTISPLVAPDEYDLRASGLPIRIQISGSAAADRIDATIVNASAPVLAADGVCLPALSTSVSNPLVGVYGPDLRLTRVPAMHSPFNDELVIAWGDGPSGMNAELFPTVAAVLGLAAPATAGDVFLHGNPTSGPTLKLHTVAGGGQACDD